MSQLPHGPVGIDDIVGLDGGPASPKGLIAKFYRRVVRDEEATAREGRPQHVSQDYVLLKIPGDHTLIVDRPVRDEDKRGYPEQYKAFVENRNQEETQGQSLRHWAAMPEHIAENFISQGVSTVEQLAGVSDGNLGSFGAIAREYRDKAKKFLDAMASIAPVTKLQGELEKRDQEIAALRMQMEQLANAQAKQKSK